MVKRKEMMNEKPGSRQGKPVSSREQNHEESANDISSSERLYNLAELQKMAGDNEDFINHAINVFIEGSEEAIVDFKLHLVEKKWKKIRDTAHKILPSYRHLEINSVIPGLVKINNKIMIENNTRGIPELVTEVISHIEKVLAEIRKEIRE